MVRCMDPVLCTVCSSIMGAEQDAKRSTAYVRRQAPSAPRLCQWLLDDPCGKGRQACLYGHIRGF